MKNSFKTLLFVVTLLVFSAHPVFALEILISPNGTMSFYEGQVLGENDEKESEESEDRQEKGEEESEKKREEKQEKQEKKMEEKRAERRMESKIKTVKPEQKSQIRVKSSNEGNSVSIEKREEQQEQERERTRERVEVKQVEEIKTSELRVEMPMARREDEGELEDKDKAKVETETERKIKNLENVREERARRQEMFEIRTQSESEDGDDQETEIESRTIKAKLRAAEFVVDPTTNDVKIVTPSGEEHVLTHLPDQAREQMQAAGLLDEAQEGVEWGTGETELSLETKDDGTVVYKTKGKETRRFFGIPFSVPSEIELDDATGQLSTTPVPESFWQKMLLRVSR